MVKPNSKPSNGNKKTDELLILTYRICTGQATHFDLEAVVSEENEEGFIKVWQSKCRYLEEGDGETVNFECELLKRQEFEKLTDPNDARCTLPLLLKLCDFYTRKFDHTETVFRRPESRMVHVPVVSPDPLVIMKRLKSTKWEGENAPENWYYFLRRCSYNEVCNLYRKTNRCGACQHFQNQFCVAKNEKVKAWDKICRHFKEMLLAAEVDRLVNTADVRERIIENILSLLFLETTNNPGKRRYEIYYAIAEKLLFRGYERAEIAESFGISLKTVDRRKEEVIVRLKEYGLNIPKLVDLWDTHIELDNRAAHYGDEIIKKDQSRENLENDEELE